MKKLLVAAIAGLALSVSAVSAQTVLRLSHNAAPGNPKAVASDKTR
jgi:TRAP-type C4-dicarboxylate transport system substrate-binding protein